MFKLPLLTVLFWLFLGLTLGWWVHSLYLLSSTQSASTQNETQLAKNALPLQTDTPIQTSHPKKMAYEDILENNTSQKKLSTSEKAILSVNASELIETNPKQAQKMLNHWINKDSDNLEALLLLAQTHVKLKQYQQALQIAFPLKNYVQDVIPIEDIDVLIRNIESAYSAHLHANKDFEHLLALYQKLILLMPGESIYYYKLAQIQNNMALYDSALATLSYISYDEIWGGKARILTQEIQVNKDVSGQREIPLEKVGNQFIISVSINGIDGARLLIDTGASICILRPQSAYQFGVSLDDVEDVTLVLPTGVVNSQAVIISSIAVDDIELEDVLASIIEMPPGLEVDGLLGMNFLKHFRFFINQKDSTLKLAPKT